MRVDPGLGGSMSVFTPTLTREQDSEEAKGAPTPLLFKVLQESLRLLREHVGESGGGGTRSESLFSCLGDEVLLLLSVGVVALGSSVSP
jgi:hypothetical protein